MGNSLGHTDLKELIEQDLSSSSNNSEIRNPVEFQYMLSSEIHNKGSYACCKMFYDNSDIQVVVKVIPKQNNDNNLEDLSSDNTSLRLGLVQTISQFYRLEKLDEVDLNDYNNSNNYNKLFLEGPFIPKHGNIPVLYYSFESNKAWYLILHMYPYTLEELLKFNRILLESDDIRRRFLFYQILQSIFFCHKNNFVHSKIIPTNILVNDMLWISLIGQNNLYLNENINQQTITIQSPPFAPSPSLNSNTTLLDSNLLLLPSNNTTTTITTTPSKTQNSISSILKTPTRSTLQMSIINNNDIRSHHTVINDEIIKYKDIVFLWQEGKISNYDYLMKLNSMAGRRLGDFQYHPIFPWVIDFEKDPTTLIESNNQQQLDDSWRDLTKTKFRLSKGDEMLDITYSSPDNPHHVTEPLSEITFFIYLARRKSLTELKKYVRHNYEPKEYPSSMTRMYQWTPDECIPEFYSDPNIFKSKHLDMEDLKIPFWASTPEEFIEKHRLALESEYVSLNLHHWIDLVFGYKLSGKYAIEAKNVMLKKENNDLFPSRFGFVQLFDEPHPPRRILTLNVNERMLLYEHSIQFSRKYFTFPIYHVLPYLEKINHKIISSKYELFNDDMFALGNLLAELYLFKPIFNNKSIEKYIREYSIYNRQPEISLLQKINQPVRSIVEKLIDLNLSKKTNFLNQFKKFFPPYFKYCYWLLSNIYLLKNYLEKYNFIMKQIKSTNTLQDNILNLSPEALDLILPHILQMFFIKKVEKSDTTINNQYLHIMPWCYGIEILRTMIGNSKKNNLLLKLKECENTKKLLKLKLYSIYLENERIEYTLNSIVKRTSSFEDLTDFNVNQQQDHISKELKEQLILLPLNLYSYSFASLLYHVVLSESNYSKTNNNNLLNSSYSDGTNFVTKDQKRIFLEQIIPFFIEGIFINLNNYSKITKKICNTLSRLSNDFGAIISIQYILEPLITKLKRKIKLIPLDENILNLLVNLSNSLGVCTIISYYVPKFLNIMLMELKINNENNLNDISFQNYKNLVELIELIIDKSNSNQTTILNNIISNNQHLFNHILETFLFNVKEFENMDNEKLLKLFERFIQFICHILHLCDLKIRIQFFQFVKPTFKKILCSSIFLESHFNQQLEVLPKYINVTKNPIVNSQISLNETSNLNNNESSNNNILIDNESENDNDKKKPGSKIRSFFGRFRSSSVTDGMSGEISVDDILSTTSTSTTTATTTNTTSNLNNNNNNIVAEEDDTSTLNILEFKNNDHFKLGCILYRELCCIFGNSTMREAVINSKRLEDNISIVLSLNENDNSICQSNNPTSQNTSIASIVLKNKRSFSNEKYSWYVQSNNRLLLEGSNSGNNNSDSSKLFKGNFECEFSTKYNDLSLRCIDVCPTDERIILTGGNISTKQLFSSPVIKLWNLEWGTTTSTYFCYQNTGTTNKTLLKSQIDKVKFITSNKFASKDTAGNIHLFDIETKKFLFTIGAGNVNNIELNGTMNFTTFETLSNNCNLLVASSFNSTNNPTLQFYDLRQSNAKHCSFEWKLFNNSLHSPLNMMYHSSTNNNLTSSTSSNNINSNVSLMNNDYNIKCISKSHSKDNYLIVGLMNGMIYLLEQHSGCIIDTFCSHEKGELMKILPYEGSKPGHFLTCCKKTITFDSNNPNSNALLNSPSSPQLNNNYMMDNVSSMSGNTTNNNSLLDIHSLSNDIIRVWDTRISSKSIKAFQIPSHIMTSPLDNDNTMNISTAPIVSFDIHSRPEWDQLFAIQPDRILYTKSNSFINTNNINDYYSTTINNNKPRQFRTNSGGNNIISNNNNNNSTTTINIARKFNQKRKKKYKDIPMDLEKREVLYLDSLTTNNNQITTNDNFTDVRYLPLHKLLLITTDTGKLKVYS
ncbi:hypothetical protein ABK040_004867 [Willaertia magna]